MTRVLQERCCKRYTEVRRSGLSFFTGALIIAGQYSQLVVEDESQDCTWDDQIFYLERIDLRVLCGSDMDLHQQTAYVADILTVNSRHTYICPS